MNTIAIEAELDQLDRIPYSFVDNRGMCCSDSMELLLDELDARASRPEDALAAIPLLKPWGPTSWPSSWCDLHGSERLDCGAQTALGSEVLTRFGVDHDRARLVLAVSEVHLSAWHRRWSGEGSSRSWLGRGLVHHEVLAIGDRLWDASSARWIGPLGSQLGSGVVVALRVGSGPWRMAGHSP